MQHITESQTHSYFGEGKYHMGLVVESMVCVIIFLPASKNVCFYDALSGSDELNVHILT